MAKSQRRPLNPPTPDDRETLQDYSRVIQDSLGELYLAAHEHSIRTDNPTVNEGSKQQISIVDTGTSVYLVVKTARGWFKSPNFMAI